MEDVTPAPEEWRAVVGLEGLYEVSDLGHMRSLDRVIVARKASGGTYAQRYRGRPLTAVPDGHGYAQIKLGRHARGHVYIFVLEAFVGPRPEGCDGCHGPGGPGDDRLVNLSWGTRAKNNGADRWRDGTALTGENAPMVKLTWEKVDEIRRRRAAAGGAQGIRRILAADYGVNVSTIDRIVAGRTWRPEARHHAPRASKNGHTTHQGM